MAHEYVEFVQKYEIDLSTLKKKIAKIYYW